MELRRANKMKGLEMQEWFPIPICENLYEACKYGFIRNAETKKVLSPATNEKGYKMVVLWDRKRSKAVTQKLHRLIALTFKPNPENKGEVNHKDGIKGNNHEANLEWNTHSENVLHAFRTGLNRPNRHQLGKYNEMNHRSKKVLQMDLTGNMVKEWPSAREAERSGFNADCISSVCVGRKKSHKGFIWKHSNK